MKSRAVSPTIFIAVATIPAGRQLEVLPDENSVSPPVYGGPGDGRVRRVVQFPGHIVRWRMNIPDPLRLLLWFGAGIALAGVALIYCGPRG